MLWTCRTCSFSAPRMINHMISSMPSEPASRTYSSRDSRVSDSGSDSIALRNHWSNRELMNPARSPAS